MHSHLLTGRVQNKALVVFAKEVLKKFFTFSDQRNHVEDGWDASVEEFRVSRKTFKKAAKRATE